MKRVAVLAALLFFAASARASEILINGGFETGDLTGWHHSSGWHVDASNPNAGDYSAMTADAFELRQDFAPVPVSDLWIIRYSIEIAGSGQMEMLLYFHSGVVRAFSMFAADHPYTNYISFFIGGGLPNDSLQGIGFIGDPESMSYLDDVSILRLDQPPDVPEPLSAVLFGAGLLGLGALRGRKIFMS